MATATTPRKSISIYDYPEHLNPFREEDNHNKIRFWTIGKKLTRSNSISFSGFKDLRNSWSLRSFMKKGKKGQTSAPNSKPSTPNGENSPIVFRRTLQYTNAAAPSPSTAHSARTTLPSPERPDRYVYGGSITPLPRSRFQERLKSPSHYEDRTEAMETSLTSTPQLRRSEVSGSRASVESTNPFEHGPVAPARASRRKKKRAPPPPPTDPALISSTPLNSSVESETKQSKRKSDDEIEDIPLDVELKIVEDADVEKDKGTNGKCEKAESQIKGTVTFKHEVISMEDDRVTKKDDDTKRTEKSELKSDNNDNNVAFAKVDIRKYRRNSSFNEDDVRLRRGNLEDFTPLLNRSKSLTNTYKSNNNYVTHEINLDDQDLNNVDKDSNGNPQKVICKLYDNTTRKESLDNSISSTEREFIELDKATKAFEREISKLNEALNNDDPIEPTSRISVSEISRKFDNPKANSPNPIPKPRRTHNGVGSPIIAKLEI